MRSFCLLIAFALIILGGCHIKGQTKSKQQAVNIDSTAYYRAKCDSLIFLASQYKTFLIGYENQLRESRDSITKLNKRPVMTEAQFIQLYKYERLLKYYKICKKNPSQWKYYKGWSIRVFEQ